MKLLVCVNIRNNMRGKLMAKENKVAKFLQNLTMTRRSFLKISAATAGVAAITTLTGCSKEETKSEEEYKVPEVVPYDDSGEWKKNSCPRNCHDTCQIETLVADGKVKRIKGGSSPYTGGNLCVKMNHYVNFLYHPDRLQYPMKRVGKKGEGKFERITWDEAYQTIAEKINQTIEEFGPNAVLPYKYSGNLGYVSNYSMSSKFFKKLGACDILGTICLGTGAALLPYTFGSGIGCDPEEYANTDLYVSWGTNEAATSVHSVKFIKELKEKKGKLIVINPVKTPVAEWADLYIRPNLGSDGALALAVANILIEEDMIDKDFIEKYTFGFEELKKEAAKYTLEKATEITGVPAEQIRELARMYGQVETSILRMGYGFQRHSNGGSMLRAISFLPALTGMIGKANNAGYVFINDGYWDVDWAQLGGSELNTNPNARAINMTDIGQTLTGQTEQAKKEPIKFMFVYDANPLTSCPNTNLIREGLKREDLFTVVHDIWHTETVNYADIVLPATTHFEEEDVNQNYFAWYINYNEKAIDPLFECKSNYQMFQELAQYMGFEEETFKMTTADTIKQMFESANPTIFGGLTYEELKEKHWHKITPGVPYGDKTFNTPSGKIEFYSETLKEAGLHPVAEFVELAESKNASPKLYKKYPLHLVSASTKNLINGQMSQIEHIRECIEENTVFIHSTDAAAREIGDGDQVVVKNDRGECKFIARIMDEKVQPGFVLAYSSIWQQFSDGNNVNAITPDLLSDIGGGSTFHSNLIEVVKA